MVEMVEMRDEEQEMVIEREEVIDVEKVVGKVCVWLCGE